mgnify:CR=1 FL=1
MEGKLDISIKSNMENNVENSTENTKKKILVIHYEPLATFAQSIASMHAIRQKHAGDEITILTEKSVVDIARNLKVFDRIWLDRKPFWFQFKKVNEIRKRIKREEFDMVYDLQNDKRSEWYFRLIGFNKPN